MKKFLAMLLAVVMVLSMAACSKQPAKDPNKGTDDPNKTVTITNPDQINDEMTSEDGKYEIAFITDVGQLKDKSFNQGTYDGVKLYAANNKLSYKYYQPANKDQATDDDRYEAMKAAVENGAKVVVCAGFMQEGALRMAAKEFPDVSFVFVDGYPITEEAGVDGSPVLKNVAGIAFKEEQCGYLAGYAVVKEGFTKLGFTGGGGGTNPACCRYGYGFVQGADAAAKELGVKVDMNYSWQYGASFSASPELQTMVSGWYEAGTEVVFACGGSMFASVAAAAGAADGKVVGVDVDQSTESDTVITSAMKGLADSVQWALGKFYSNEFASIGGVGTSLGANENAVGLPTATWSLTKWTVDEYNTMLKDIVDGKITIDKYGKSVTLEAIQNYGYDVAVQKTDDEFLYDLTALVTDKFYKFLNTGTLKGTPKTFQMALAHAKGAVENKFKTMHRTVTGVVGFVNVMDVYDYLGNANITVQNQFGFQYIKDFMGYNTIFLLSDSEIAKGKVIATPVDNIVMYYVDPADSEFARAGLVYRTAGEASNLIGFHTQANYSTATSESYAIMGVTLFAEYLDGIAVETITPGE